MITSSVLSAKINSNSLVVEDISSTPCNLETSSSVKLPSQCEIAWSANVRESLTDPFASSTIRSIDFLSDELIATNLSLSQLIHQILILN